MSWDERFLFRLINKWLGTKHDAKPALTKSLIGSNVNDTESAHSKGEAKQMVRSVQTRGLMKATAIVTIFQSILVAIVLIVFRNSLADCPLAMFYAAIIVFTILTVMAMYVTFVIRKVQVFYRIREEISLSLFFALGSLYLYVAGNLVGERIHFGLGSTFYIVIVIMLIHSMSVTFPLVMTYVDSRSQFTHTMESLIQLLNDPSRLKDLKKISIQCMSVENILFMEELIKVRSISNGNGSSVQLYQMYYKFVPQNSAQELNIPESLRKEVVAKMKARKLTVEDFVQIEKEVLRMIYNGPFTMLYNEKKKRQNPQ